MLTDAAISLASKPNLGFLSGIVSEKALSVQMGLGMDTVWL